MRMSRAETRTAARPRFPENILLTAVSLAAKTTDGCCQVRYFIRRRRTWNLSTSATENIGSHFDQNYWTTARRLTSSKWFPGVISSTLNPSRASKQYACGVRNNLKRQGVRQMGQAWQIERLPNNIAMAYLHKTSSPNIPAPNTREDVGWRRVWCWSHRIHESMHILLVETTAIHQCASFSTELYQTAMKNMQYNPYLWPNRRHFREFGGNRDRGTRRWRRILYRKWKDGRFAHALWKYAI